MSTPITITYEQFLESKLNELESFRTMDFATQKRFIDSILRLESLDEVIEKSAPGYTEGFNDGYNDYDRDPEWQF
jgi:hypothetical protein